MGLIQRYDKDVAAGLSQLIRNPNQPIQAPDNVKFDEENFTSSSLDLTNPSPLGGPINIPYTTKIGTETKTFTTTQPFTPDNTYIDSFQNPDLIERARDPFR